MTEDTYSYRGWLNSDKFHKRLLAMMLYFGIAYSIYFVVLFITGFTIGALFP